MSAAIVAAALGCQTDYVVVDIGGDAHLPGLLDRVRIDVFDKARWTASGDFPLPASFGDRPGYEGSPVSFALTSRGPDQPEFLVRVRGYRRGQVRAFQGDHYEARPPAISEPLLPASLEALCAKPTPVLLGTRARLSLGAKAFPDGATLTCDTARTTSGLAAGVVTIEQAGEYRFEIVSARPEGAWAPFADTVLIVGAACSPAGALGCNDDGAGLAGPDRLSSLVVTLSPGSYHVLVGNKLPNPVDLQLLVTLVEQPEAPAEPTAAMPASAPPMREGAELTPRDEPLPDGAIDRLALVSVPRGEHTAFILLEAECFGLMSNLKDGQTCFGGSMAPVPVTPVYAHSGRTRVVREMVGSGDWAKKEAETCSGTPARSVLASDVSAFGRERVCVPGGAFLLGDASIVDGGDGAGSPERPALLDRFYIDKYEYTVGRYREARRRHPDLQPSGGLAKPTQGFRGPDAPRCSGLADASGEAPSAASDALPLSCVSWQMARELCALDNGDLPTVAQRQRAAALATVGGVQTRFPWGNHAPACDTAILSGVRDPRTGQDCPEHEPVAVDAEPWAMHDEIQGIVGLGGNLSEWTLDSYRSYDKPCWSSKAPAELRCDEQDAPLRTVMGGSWRLPAEYARGAARLGVPPAAALDSIGFRCVYKEAKAP